MQNLSKTQQLLAKIVSVQSTGWDLCALMRLAIADGIPEAQARDHRTYIRHAEASGLTPQEILAVMVGWDQAVDREMGRGPHADLPEEYVNLGRCAAVATGAAGLTATPPIPPQATPEPADLHSAWERLWEGHLAEVPA